MEKTLYNMNQKLNDFEKPLYCDSLDKVGKQL